MFAQTHQDLVVCLSPSIAGVEVPKELVNYPASSLCFDGKKIFLAVENSKWLVDDMGRKRIPSMHPESGWQELECAWDAELIKDQASNEWRAKTSSELQVDAIAKARADAIIELRRHIAKNVADTESLLGTVSDATGLLIAIALADVVALSSNTSFADYRKAKLDTLKLLAGDADIAALAGGALQQIQSGDVVLTASLKGLENVITESLSRSTAVATILAQDAQQQASGENP